VTRYALFLAPLPGDALDVEAARWLGRDVYVDTEPRQTGGDGIGADEQAELTATARRYGFHGTMKAPFPLADGAHETDLVNAFNAYCLTVPAMPAPRLRLGNLDGFFALVPDGPAPAIDALARDLVATFDRFRAPLSEADIARRNPDRLAPNERANLQRWGYPYVMEAFRFHMTLTHRVREPDQARVEAALASRFGHIVRVPLTGLALALFVERAPGALFNVLSWRQLTLLPAADPVPT